MLDRIEEAIEAIKDGKLVIVVDDEDRENEGDFIVAARHATPEVINFMSKEGRGLICAALTEQRCDELELKPMVVSNTSLHETAFTVSVDLNCADHRNDIKIEGPNMKTGRGAIISPNQALKLMNL